MVVALLAMNVIQLGFWSICVHRLIDKIMSKNYAEYVSTKSYRPKESQTLPDNEISAEEQAILDELNGKFSH